VRGILADNDVQGQVEFLLSIWLSDSWRDLWHELGLIVERFSTLGLSRHSPDALIWRTCQASQLVLITANRNRDGPDSLEAVIRNENQPGSLPVMTLANPTRVSRDRVYAEKVAEKLLEHLMSIDDLRGSGRIYVP
jgi:hypothetical protein